MLYSIELRSQLPARRPGYLSLGSLDALRFLDASLLAGELAEVEDTSAANVTELVDLNLLDERRLERENSFNTYAA